jgi:hypothetical protein
MHRHKANELRIMRKEVRGQRPATYIAERGVEGGRERVSVVVDSVRVRDRGGP